MSDWMSTNNTTSLISLFTNNTTSLISLFFSPEHGNLFRSLGIFEFAAGTTGSIVISNDGTEGKYAIADAVQLLPVVDKGASNRKE
jgi:hypothetical protein